MSKRNNFILEIYTSGELTEEQTNQMAQNVADAIVSHAKTTGITPEESGALTEIVYVRGWHSDKQIIEHVY